MPKPNKEQKERAAALDKLEKQFEKELIHNYQVALKEIRARIAFSYEKYDGNWIEMNRYNRLTKLEKEIAEEIRKLTGKNAQTLIRGMMDLFEESYYRTAYVLTNAVNSDLGFVLLDRELVRKAIDNPLDRVGFLQRNRDNQARLTRQLREQLTQSLIQGEGYGKAAERIKERMNVGATNAMRIAQTENHRTRIQGQLENMKDGIERGIILQKMWLSTVDSRTRDAHGRLDGVQIDLDQQFEIDGYKAEAPALFGVPHLDINCRCQILEIVDGFKPQQRLVRGVGVTEYRTYSEFKKMGLIAA